jgi:ferric-dicitrate binding protein FerR (iron transport regulator)
MALPASQQRVLDVIESELRIADPKLIRAFAAFSNITGTADMPRAEQLRRRRTRTARRPSRSGRRPAISAWLIWVVVVSLLMTAGVMLNLSQPLPSHCPAAAMQIAPPAHAC